MPFVRRVTRPPVEGIVKQHTSVELLQIVAVLPGQADRDRRFGAAHAAPIARRVFDYLLLDQYPNPQDLDAVSKGPAGRPVGPPLKASTMPWPPEAAADPAVK